MNGVESSTASSNVREFSSTWNRSLHVAFSEVMCTLERRRSVVALHRKPDNATRHSAVHLLRPAVRSTAIARVVRPAVKAVVVGQHVHAERLLPVPERVSTWALAPRASRVSSPASWGEAES